MTPQQQIFEALYGAKTRAFVAEQERRLQLQIDDADRAEQERILYEMHKKAVE